MFRVILALDILVLVSTFVLIQLLSLPETQLDDVSRCRFICMLVVNAIFFASTIFFFKIQDRYYKIVFFFVASFIIVFAMTLSEMLAKKIEIDTSVFTSKTTSKRMWHLEMTWLTLYYITYGFSILALFVSGIFLAVVEVLETLEQYRL